MTSPSTRTLRRILLAKAGAGVVLTVAFGGGWWLRANGLTVGEVTTELRRGRDPRFQWRSVDRKHWQALVQTSDGRPPAEERPELTDAREGNGAGCGTGMVRVKGNYRAELNGEATGEIERIQDGACTDWISKEFPARCRTFDKDKIAAEVAKLPTKPLDYCMDRFEYPNVLGQNPVIVVTFREADQLCRQSKKRLCTETEWTFACEGEEVRPYPYGYTRDATACVVDRAWRPFAEGALSPRDGAKAREELDRLWQGEPSGSRGACRSPFGVYDMTGNVDEWTRSVRPTGFTSTLKGGYWGPVRARCRPATRAHNEDFVAYQQGFRCCADSNANVPAPTPPVAAAPASSPAGPAGGAKAPAADPARKPHAGLEPEHATSSSSADDADGDEVDAITKARVRLACAVEAPGAGTASRSRSGSVAFGLGPTLALAALAAAARRRRPRT